MRQNTAINFQTVGCEPPEDDESNVVRLLPGVDPRKLGWGRAMLLAFAVMAALATFGFNLGLGLGSLGSQGLFEPAVTQCPMV